MEKAGKALTWTELRVGSVAVVSLIILAVTILYVGASGTPLAPHYDIHALMSDVNGLKPGAPVRVGGVDVGTVTKVDFGGARARGMVEVTMRIDERVRDRVTTESQATLGSLGLLGEKAVDVSSSTRGTPIENDGYVAAATEDAFKGLLSDASSSTAHLRRVLSRMDAGEGLVGKALRDDELYTRMVDVSLRLQGVMGRLESDKGPLGRLMNDQEIGYGVAAIIVAFVGRLHPLGVLLSSALMSLFYIGGELAQSRLGLPKALTGVFQGLLLFALLGCDAVAQRLRAGLRAGGRR